MKNVIKDKISLMLFFLLIFILIMLFHLDVLEGEHKLEYPVFFALLIGFMIAHNMKVTRLKKDIEIEIQKNRESNEMLVLKYNIENTLSQISSLLAFSDDLDEKIEEALSLLGKLCNADRAYVFKFQANQELTDNTHEWCAIGVKPQKDELQDLPGSMYSWWMTKLRIDEAIHIKDLAELPPEAEAEKAILEKQDIKSLIVLPFKMEGELAGFIGFDNVKETGEWGKNDIETLKTFSNMLGMAFQKKTVLEDLNREREQLLSVFDSIDDPIYVSDPYTHEILYVNNFLNELLDENPLGKQCYKVLQGFDRPCDFCTNHIILQNKKKAYQWEYHNPVTCRDYLISDRIIKWLEGRDVRLELTHDITEIRKAARVLKENDENFRKIIDSSPLPIAIMDSNGNFEYTNMKLTEMLGYTIKDIPDIGKWWETVYPDNECRNMARDNWERVSINKETGLIGEWTVTCKDGNKRQVMSYFTKTNKGIVFILNDLTDLKRTEEALLLDESCLETLHELSQMNIFSIAEIKSFALEEGIKLTKSKMGMIGFFDEQNQNFSTDIYPEDLLLLNNINKEILMSLLESTGFLQMFVAGKKPVILNRSMDRLSSPEFVFCRKLSLESYLTVPILNENEVVGFVAVANKESEYTVSDLRQLTLIAQMMGRMILLKRSEDELKKYNQKLLDINTELSKTNKEMHSLDELKNSFLSTISHELKTPLISIIGFSELVGDETLGSLNKEQKRAMNVVTSNSGQLKRLIESLLFMSCLEAKNYSYDYSNLPVKPIIENALMVISMENADKKLIVENKLPSGLHYVIGDSNYLSELFIHLIDNAFKFTPSEGRVSIHGSNEEKSIHIVIEDTGIGIPETKIMKTFDRFYQLDGSLTRKYGGAGIGLNICKRITEDHGGKLWIESMEGVGTKVHITLPAIKKCVSH
ncbi:ATP-binding protein [Methanolobus psychrotolerans]|uniref:ATP-binding protein n=1 Tax=Methanolobus psychrotolerans TaxID=1874706 RepID=UPI000B91CE4F|nr:ATP-binding protein [Methanolobus psychrotolerans]